MRKLIVTSNGAEYVDLTEEEIQQREIEAQQAEEQKQLDSLIPSPEEVQKAEFELMAIELLPILLTELGVL